MSWRGWWRIVRIDQWGVFFTGAILGMVLPAILYVTFLAAGRTSVALASRRPGEAVDARGTMLSIRRFHRRMDPVQDPARRHRGDGPRHHRHDVDRQRADSCRARGDVRRIYYSLLGMVVIWGMITHELVHADRADRDLGGNVAGLTGS